MRIGFARLAHKSSTKQPLLHHATSAARRRRFPQLSSYDRHSRSFSSGNALRSSHERLDEAENKLRESKASAPDTTYSTSRHSYQKKRRRKEKGRLGSHNDEVPDERRRDPATWSNMLNEIYLQAGATLPHNHIPASSPHDNDMHIRILNIMRTAAYQQNANTDLITYIGIKQSRWKAVLWITDTLLQNVSMCYVNQQNAGPPSNIGWGSEKQSLTELTSRPFSVRAPVYANLKTVEAITTFELDPKYSVAAADTSDQKLLTMNQIWKSLGCLVIEAADLPDDESEVVMAVVYQIIAKVHALGLVPDNVYSYIPLDYSSMVSRPPILHLLSSRVLTTLSDATWRTHQMDVIEQAVSQGTPLKSLVKDLPGGRFRLKVRPLGPEIWLEFVLWCCVEGGFGPVGAFLVGRLQEKTQNPWFAMPWISQTGSDLSATIDWDRVHSRHGGPVGLIEGYNRERPFVEMASRTVSAEVVLMLVETMIDSVNTGVPGRSFTIDTVALRTIPRMLRFLEPHNLPVDYFDYLAVRLLQTGGFDVKQHPELLERWAERVSEIRSLASTVSTVPNQASFDVSSIIQQSEVFAGILHQAMESYVENVDVRSAITVFNHIQELVDVSKVQSISAFLALTSIDEPGTELWSPVPFTQHTSNLDFVRSHGQLPMHKLAAFLNLTTESKLFRIGQWLLSSDEVDEPIIPRRLFGRPTLSTALVRYAGLSGNEELVAEIIKAQRESPLLPSVSWLRSLADALVSNYNFKEAHKVLIRLTRAKGGGFGPKNLATLAAATMYLESRKGDGPTTIVDDKLSEAWRLIHGTMNGYYDGRLDTYRLDVTAVYRQQVAAVLFILSSIPGSQISTFVRKYQTRFPLKNMTLLGTDTFNVILAAVVDNRGAEEGVRLWQWFCNDTAADNDRIEEVVLDDVLADENENGDDEDYLWSRPLSSMAKFIATEKDVPFVESFATSPRHPDSGLSRDTHENEENLRSHSEFADPFPIEADIKEDQEPEPTFLVKPDLRSLRVIVQGALSARRARHEQGLDTSSQKKVLQWAAQFYEQFGTSSKIIQQEIQLPFDEHTGYFGHQRSLHEDRDKKKRRVEAAAAFARESQAGHVYQQFHGWRPVTGRKNIQNV